MKSWDWQLSVEAPAQALGQAPARTPAQAPAEEAGTLISLCAVRVGDSSFGIGTREIREVLEPRPVQPVPLSPRFVAGVLPYRGEVLTAISLRVLLRMPCAPGSVSSEACVLVLECPDEDGCFGLLVDAIGGVVSVPPECFTENPSMLDPASQALFAGAYRMHSGLLVRLRTDQLRPRWLASSGLFSTAKNRLPHTQEQGAAECTF